MLETLGHFIDTSVKTDPGIRIYPDVFKLMDQHTKSIERKRIAVKLFSAGTERRHPEDHRNGENSACQ